MSDQTNIPPFRELTLWQVMQLLIYHPERTLQRFFAEIALERREHTPDEPFYEEESQPQAAPELMPLASPMEEEVAAPLPTLDALLTPAQAELQRSQSLNCGLLAGMVSVVFFALVGGIALWNAALDNATFGAGGLKSSPFWFGLAIIIYIVMSLAASGAWWQERLKNLGVKPTDYSQADSTAPIEEAESTPAKPIPFMDSFLAGVERHSVRMALIPVGIVLAYLAYTQNVIYDETGKLVKDVSFTTNGALAWLFAILVWFGVLAVDLNAVMGRVYRRLVGEGSLFQQRITFTWRPGWQHAVLLLILLLAGFFRLHNLAGVPPDMTSDHMEKLLDSLRVYDGYHGIFFANNGGREGFQMHFVAWLVEFGGLDFSFRTLKIATAIEGLLAILLAYPLGLVVMGREKQEDRQLGMWLGLSMAALMAISSWHTMLSRLGLRIVLTPLTAIIVLIFLLRAMRFNRRMDFVLMGIILGAGTYFYQSNRMLPFVVLAGMVLAVPVMARTWSDVGRYVLNFACTVILAVVVFLPMYRYQQAYPEDFWNRTRGRLFGEGAFVRVNPQTGLSEPYEPGVGEQLDLFFEKFDVFEDNLKDALRMWSWRGDGEWINNGKSRPALDPYTDGLFLLGLAGFLLLFLKRWDVGFLLIPIGIVIMILPSALTLAYTVENPSYTRASGALPFVMLVAAYPLAQMGYYASRVVRHSLGGAVLGVLLIAPIVGFAARVDYDNYFTIYRDTYSQSWKPYEGFAKPMREFATGEGSWGNAFMIAHPFWLDHRILGTVAGDIHWGNGLVNRTDVFSFITRNAGTPYAYDPEKPTFFMYNTLDQETDKWLAENFPGGERRVIEVAGRPELNFYVYITPPNVDWESIEAAQPE